MHALRSGDRLPRTAPPPVLEITCVACVMLGYGAALLALTQFVLMALVPGVPHLPG